jgi:hypothetical protein
MRALIAPFVLSIATLLHAPSSAFAAPTASIGGGSTAIRLTAPFTTTLSSLNMTVSKIEESTVRNGAIVSPVIEGVLDRADARGEVQHSGGIRFGRNSVFVRFSNFILDTTGAAPVLTADVVVNNSVVSRQPVFDVTLPTLTLPIPNSRRLLSIRSMTLALRTESADILNAAFGTTTFAAGLSVGRASTGLIFGRSPQGILRGASDQR